MGKFQKQAIKQKWLKWIELYYFDDQLYKSAYETLPCLRLIKVIRKKFHFLGVHHYFSVNINDPTESHTFMR